MKVLVLLYYADQGIAEVQEIKLTCFTDVAILQLVL